MRKKRKQEIPAGCRICKGKPWVEVKGGMRRCTCPRGVWFQQRDRERQQQQRSCPAAFWCLSHMEVE
jgi:hypothetical protein